MLTFTITNIVRLCEKSDGRLKEDKVEELDSYCLAFFIMDHLSKLNMNALRKVFYQKIC